MIIPNPLRRALTEKTELLGALVTMPGWTPPRVFARAGYGLLIIDLQHEPLSASAVAESIASGVDAGCACVVRIQAGRFDQIGAVLDAGADGVVVPMISSREDAVRATRACRYPPIGTRSVGGSRAQLLRGRRYFDQADSDIVCAIQIEHIDAVGEIAAILSVPGIDAVLPGPVDLTRSLGIAAGYSALREPPRETVEAFETVRAACRDRGVAYIGIVESDDDLRDARARGDRIVLSGSDISLFSRAARDNVKRVKNGLSQSGG